MFNCFYIKHNELSLLRKNSSSSRQIALTEIGLHNTGLIQRIALSLVLIIAAPCTLALIGCGAAPSAIYIKEPLYVDETFREQKQGLNVAVLTDFSMQGPHSDDTVTLGTREAADYVNGALLGILSEKGHKVMYADLVTNGGHLSAAIGDEIHLTDGNVISGKVMKETPEEVTIAPVTGGTVVVDRSIIARVDYTEAVLAVSQSSDDKTSSRREDRIYTNRENRETETPVDLRNAIISSFNRIYEEIGSKEEYDITMKENAQVLTDYYSGVDTLLLLRGQCTRVSKSESAASALVTGAITTLATGGRLTAAVYPVSQVELWTAAVDAKSGKVLWCNNYTVKGKVADLRNPESPQELRKLVRSCLGAFPPWDDAIVYITRDGTTYHRADCPYVRHKKLTSIGRNEAIRHNYRPCKRCKP